MKLKKTLTIILIVCLLVTSSHFVTSAKEETVEGTFRMFGHTATREYQYNDSYFSNDSDRYDHGLARLSLGLALAAGRNTQHPDTQDEYLIDFLQNQRKCQMIRY